MLVLTSAPCELSSSCCRSTLIHCGLLQALLHKVGWLLFDTMRPIRISRDRWLACGVRESSSDAEQLGPLTRPRQFSQFLVVFPRAHTATWQLAFTQWRLHSPPDWQQQPQEGSSATALWLPRIDCEQTTQLAADAIVLPVANPDKLHGDYAVEDERTWQNKQAWTVTSASASQGDDSSWPWQAAAARVVGKWED